jgi:hypothetical protein
LIWYSLAYERTLPQGDRLKRNTRLGWRVVTSPRGNAHGSTCVEDPTYNVILAWDPEAMPANWEAGRRRYFTINWIQLAVTWSAFALFLLALISL